MSEIAGELTEDEGPPWDLTDPANPQPLIYPVCAECGLPYVYSSAWSIMTSKTIWAWFRPAGIPKGCRHRKGLTKNTVWAKEREERSDDPSQN